MTEPRKEYANTRFGQMHLRIWGNGTTAPHTCIVCLHPIPYAGSYFDTFARALPHQVVIAPDLMGYGGSDPVPGPLSIADHAAAVADALDAMQEAGFRDADFIPLGFHTGAAVGGELAIAHRELVSRAIFVTYPYFDSADRAGRLAGVVDSTPISDDPEFLRSRWDFTVSQRPAGVPLVRALTNFSEELRAGDRAWFGFHAMFSYTPEERLPRVRQHSLVINTEGALREPTRIAARLLPDCECLELLHMQKAIFELHPHELASAVTAFLG